MSNQRKSFIEVLGDTAPKRKTPLLRPIARGFGTTDTLPHATRVFAQAEDAHMDAVVRRKNKPIFNPSNFYLLEDTKSRADAPYQQTNYVKVTREEFRDRSHIGMIARRTK